MASINDYFNIDNEHNITIRSETVLSRSDGTTLPIRMHQNLASGSWYCCVQLPHVENALAYCLGMISSNSNLIDAITAALPKMIVSSSWNSSQPSSNPVNTADLRFCGRVYLYSQFDLSHDEIQLIHSEGLKRGLFVEYYGPRWAEERSRMEKPLAFISHDWRDKESIAKPLALALSKAGIPVWFDEFSLKIGDSLRESIERGIRETKFCVLVVTNNFLSNNSWTKVEFASVFAREIVQKEKVVLPIWHEVSQGEVYDYSPSLVDRLAARWSDGVDNVAAKIKNRIKSS